MNLVNKIKDLFHALVAFIVGHHHSDEEGAPIESFLGRSNGWSYFLIRIS
jgi:hypothetical protein